MPKHVFFDLDNTLTRSRTVMSSDHEALFKRLCEKADVIVVSGAQQSQIQKQISASCNGLYYILGQQGNQAFAKDGSVLWRNMPSDAQTQAVLSFIKIIHDELALEVKDENDLVEVRGCQIAYSLIGHNEDVEKKYAFDPGSAKRKAVLAAHQKDVDALHAIGMDISPGGTTCFDFSIAGKNKGNNVASLVELQGWGKSDCLYIGDELEPGRNDESVIGIIPTQLVVNPDDTFRFIEQNLLS